MLCLSSILSVFCVLIHGIVDVPGQKIGILIIAILLIGITLKPNNKDRILPKYNILTYQLLAVGIFSLGLILIYSQWIKSYSFIFSDSQSCMNKIQKKYQLSINAAKERDIVNQKKFITSAIHLTEEAIKRTPLDSDLYFIRGKLLSFLNGNIHSGNLRCFYLLT